MKLKFMALCASFLIATNAMPAERADVLRIAVPPGGFAPYIDLKANGTPTGIMFEILESFASKKQLRVTTVLVPKKRAEEMVLNRLVDVVPRAREWTKDPERFSFSVPVLEVNDVVFSLAEKPVVYSSPRDLEGKRVGAHLGYSYPRLDAYFGPRMQRDDALNEEQMLKKMLAGRTDVVVANDLVVHALIERNHWRGLFAYGPVAVDTYDIGFMFGPEWAPFVAEFNEELTAMRADGRLRKIEDKYLRKREGAAKRN